MTSVRGLIAIGGLIALAGSGASETLTVIQTASTNRHEMRLTVSEDNAAASLAIGNAEQTVQCDNRERKLLFRLAKAVGPLASLPASHCMKSASFGSRLFLEMDGQRSPDLSCPNQTDPQVTALQAELRKILQSAQSQVKDDSDTGWKRD